MSKVVSQSSMIPTALTRVMIVTSSTVAVDFVNDRLVLLVVLDYWMASNTLSW